MWLVFKYKAISFKSIVRRSSFTETTTQLPERAEIKPLLFPLRYLFLVHSHNSFSRKLFPTLLLGNVTVHMTQPASLVFLKTVSDPVTDLFDYIHSYLLLSSACYRTPLSPPRLWRYWRTIGTSHHLTQSIVHFWLAWLIFRHSDICNSDTPFIEIHYTSKNFPSIAYFFSF